MAQAGTIIAAERLTDARTGAARVRTDMDGCANRLKKIGIGHSIDFGRGRPIQASKCIGN
jgi:hypothetical protein